MRIHFLCPNIQQQRQQGNMWANTDRHVEQKRRQAIREGFDRLTELVPGLEGQGRSEGLVLKKTVDYMREQIAERQVLVDRVEGAGGDVDEKLKR